MKSILFIFTLLFSFNVFAYNLSIKQKLSDLSQLVHIMKSGYGPIDYKKSHRNVGVDIDKLHYQYKKLISETKTNKDFYYLIVKFVAEFKDSHFGARIPSNFVSKLPFSTDLVNGKVLIDKIEDKKLVPFNKGDEIVSVDGKPIAEVLADLVPYMGQGNDKTALRKAAMLVPLRSATQVPAQEGKVIVEVKMGTTEHTIEHEFTWKHSGKHLDEYIPVAKKAKKNLSKYRSKDSIYNFDNISLMEDRYFEKSFRCSGKTRTFIPKDAVKVMVGSDVPFDAYYHKTPKGNVGYLRIPHYYPQDKNKKFAFEERFKQYEYAVSVLEKNTIGLIIDQDHNCGGSVSYLHMIVSLFARESFAPMQFELLATKESLLDFKGWSNEYFKNTLDKVNNEKVIDLIQDGWENNIKMTNMTSITGQDLIAPHTIGYTKPIIVLIDEMSGSGGDAFPAIMQGIGRAKLLGSTTMGAGGHVVKAGPLKYSQMSLRITKSLFYRPDGVAVENNGAVPDIPYTITRNDFIHEYRDYQKFYISELLKLIE